MIKVQITENDCGIELEYNTLFDTGLAMTTLATVFIGSRSMREVCEKLAPALVKAQQRREQPVVG